MQWKPAATLALMPVAALIAPAVAHAKIYVSVEETQQRLFPGEKLTPNPVVLTEAQREKMRDLSSVREPFRGERVWKTAKGDWFIVDEVVGKHEMVKYALAINADELLVAEGAAPDVAGQIRALRLDSCRAHTVVGGLGSGRLPIVLGNQIYLVDGGMIKRLTEEVEVGKIYLGTVRKIMDFGAFVEVLPGTDGLVHISQLAHHRVKAVTDEVKEGDQIQVKVLEIDKQGKIRLSRKEAMPAPAGSPATEPTPAG